MDRRSFLGLLGAAGVLTGAVPWLNDLDLLRKFAPGAPELDDDDLSPWLDSSDLAVYGRPEGRTHELFAMNNSDVPAFVSLTRPLSDGGSTLLDFVIAPKGMVRWVGGRGGEIYGPVRIIVPEYVGAQVIGTDALGRLVSASRDGVVPVFPR